MDALSLLFQILQFHFQLSGSRLINTGGFIALATARHCPPPGVAGYHVVITLSLWKEIQEDLLGYSSEEETKEISADAALIKV